MRLTERLKRDIKNHALNSIYRLNAKTADCYAFNLVRNSKNKLDFEGGWDWQNDLIDKQAKNLFILASGEFIKLC